MSDKSETDRNVFVDPSAIKMWSAERGVIPVYYEKEGRYELVPEGEVTKDHERHAWDEFTDRFGDRNEVLVHRKGDDGVESAEFVDRGRIDPHADVAGTSDPHADGTATTDPAERDADTDGTAERGTDTDGTAERGTDTDGTAERDTDGTAERDAELDASDEGNRVFDRDGNEIGIVEAVDEDGTLYVDPDPGVLDEVKAELGWGNEDEDNYVITPDEVASREGHQIVVRGP